MASTPTPYHIAKAAVDNMHFVRFEDGRLVDYIGLNQLPIELDFEAATALITGGGQVFAEPVVKAALRKLTEGRIQ